MGMLPRGLNSLSGRHQAVPLEDSGTWYRLASGAEPEDIGRLDGRVNKPGLILVQHVSRNRQRSKSQRPDRSRRLREDVQSPWVPQAVACRQREAECGERLPNAVMVQMRIWPGAAFTPTAAASPHRSSVTRSRLGCG